MHIPLHWRGQLPPGLNGFVLLLILMLLLAFKNRTSKSRSTSTIFTGDET